MGSPTTNRSWFTRGALIVALVGVVVVGNPQPCLACQCIESTEEEDFARAEVVFTGTAVNRSDPNAAQPNESSIDPIIWTFDVESVRKGSAAQRQDVRSTRNGGTCGFTFELGQRYDVFAYRNQDGQLATNTCSGTRPAEAPAEQPTPPATVLPSPSPTIEPTASAGPTSPAIATATPEPTETTRSVVWPLLAGALALGALGLASVLAFRRRS